MTMRFRLSMPPVVFGFIVSQSLAAQSELGLAPGRAFILHQRAYWLSHGVDPRAVSARDTTLTLVMDSVQPDPDMLSFQYDFEPTRLSDWGSGQVRLALDRSKRFVGLRLEPGGPAGEMGVTYESSLVAALAELPWWIGAPPRRTAREWRDSLRVRVAYEHDTLEVFRWRSLQLLGEAMVNGRKWQRMRSRGPIEVRGARRVDVYLPHVAWKRTTLIGQVQEDFLYDPAGGLIDSVRSQGRLDGVLIFRGPGARSDTVAGRWEFRRLGAWGEDPRAAAAKQLEYFMVHGRDSLDAIQPDDPFAGLRDRVRAGDTTVLDSLLAARAAAPDPFARQAVDSALWSSAADDMESRFLRVAGAAYRPGDDFLLDRLLATWRYGRRKEALPLELATTLSVQLGSLRQQRATLLDREEVFSAILSALDRGGGVVREAGPAVSNAARRADDPYARDLLLLMAYQADPPANLSVLQQLADSIEGYGPIAREYAEGNSGGMHQSWGVKADHKIEGRRFPGPESPWHDLARYLEDHPDSAGRRRHLFLSLAGKPDTLPQKVLLSWLEARGIDGRSVFRRRYLEEHEPRARLVWARYVLMWGDTIAFPWLRSLASRNDGAISNRAWHTLLANLEIASQPVTDDSILTSLQDALLTYYTTGRGLEDTTGSRVNGVPPHDERPDKRLLVEENLTPATVAVWERNFEVVSTDSVRRLADAEGLVMALTVEPVRQLEDVYFASFALHPYGAMCLCGGGSTFALKRKDGKWIVLESMSWVS